MNPGVIIGDCCGAGVPMVYLHKRASSAVYVYHHFGVASVMYASCHCILTDRKREKSCRCLECRERRRGSSRGPSHVCGCLGGVCLASAWRAEWVVGAVYLLCLSDDSLASGPGVL